MPDIARLRRENHAVVRCWAWQILPDRFVQETSALMIVRASEFTQASQNSGAQNSGDTLPIVDGLGLDANLPKLRNEYFVPYFRIPEPWNSGTSYTHRTALESDACPPCGTSGRDTRTAHHPPRTVT